MSLSLALGEPFEPLCFSREVFQKPSFNVDEFIAECRKRVPLETVLKDLQTYKSAVEAELVDLINKDYADFISLSSKLVGLDKMINELRGPLLQLKKEVGVVCSSLASTIEEIERKLQTSREIVKKKETLKLFVDISKSVSSIERLLHIDPSAWSGENGTSDTSRARQDINNILLNADEETSNLIQRVASEFNQLKYYVSRGKDYPFVKKMSQRIHFIETALQQGMERLFKEGTNNKNVDIIANCLRTYAAIDRTAEAEALFRTAIVRPFVMRAITAARLEAGIRGSCNGLRNICDDIVGFIERECGLHIELTRKAIKGFDFLSNAIWPEVADALTRLSSLFSPGIPDIFHRNYTLIVELLDRIEQQFCKTKAELRGFRSHPSYTQFMAKWHQMHMPIYGKLRYAEISKKLEAALDPSALSVNPSAARTVSTTSTTSEFHVSATNTLWECLRQCWAPDVYLRPLTHLFFRLALQLLARYHSWLLAGLAKLAPAAVGGVAADVSTGPSWAAISPEDYVYLYADVERFVERIGDGYLGIVAQGAPSLSTDVLLVMEEGFAEATAALQQQVLPGLAGLITATLAKRCCDSLLPIKGITATYRMTNKQPPTRASYYVPNVLAALATFLKEKGMSVSVSTRTTWTLRVVTAVTERFIELSTELLQAVSSMEKMGFLKKASALSTSTDAGGEPLTDTDKIALQLYLDVVEFGRLLTAEFGINRASFEPWDRLRRTVAVAEKLVPRVPGITLPE